MNRLLLLLLVALGAHVLPANAFAADDDEERIEAAGNTLRRANLDADAARRAAALDVLVELASPESMQVVRDAYAAVARRRRSAEAAILRATYDLERKVVLLEELKLRAEQDSEIGATARAVEGQIRELESTRETARETAGREGLACDEMRAGVDSILGALGSSKSKKALEVLWDGLEDGRAEIRLGSVELLGRVGGPGTAVQFQELLADVEVERTKLKRELPDLEQELRDMEQRLQAEADANGGNVYQDTLDLHAKAQRAAAVVRTALTELSYLIDACVESGGEALARESGEDLEKSLKDLVRAQRKAKGGVRMRTIALLARGTSDPVRAALREILAKEKEPLARAAIIDGLAGAGDAALGQMLIDTYLEDESWHVRSRAVAALDRLRVKDGIPALIDRLDVEQGRVRTDVVAALQSLTGQRIQSNVELWRRWWSDQGAGFEVPPLDDAPKSVEELAEAARDTVGVSFFGIRTESTKVLFIVDVSGSMNFPMYVASGPVSGGGGGRGGNTRLEVAQRELKNALGGLPEEATFNIVRYAFDVWDWQPRPQTMSVDVRTDANAHVDGLVANGGTNIFGSLQRAFELAGVRDGDSWSEPVFDTIFLLSDGLPTVGVTTEANEILAFVEERNRSAGIVIHTIGLSHEHDVYLMRSLAEQNGGIYAAR